MLSSNVATNQTSLHNWYIFFRLALSSILVQLEKEKYHKVYQVTSCVLLMIQSEMGKYYLQNRCEFRNQFGIRTICINVEDN